MDRLSDLTQAQWQAHRVRDYMRWLSCTIDTTTASLAAETFLTRWPRSLSKDLVIKAAVAAGNTTDPSWAGALVVDGLSDAFVALARGASLLGRIPGLRTIPFHVKYPVETQGANYYWVQEGKPKPISKLSFGTTVTLGATKIAGTVVTTTELAKLSQLGTEAALRDTLINGLTLFTDRQFLDPAVATVPDVHPGSITNGLTPVASTGDLAKDVGTLLKTFYTARPGAQAAVLIMGGAAAAALTGVSGQPGSAYGLPIVISEAALNNVIAIDPAGVFVADGQITIRVSNEATVEMVDTPASPPTAATVYLPLWQTNHTGFLTERVVNWQALAGAVQFLAVA